MKHIKKIDEYMGIYRKFWSIKKTDFENFLFDVTDAATEVRIEYCYITDIRSLQISSSKFADPDAVTYAPQLNDSPCIAITIQFHETEQVDKSAEFYNCLAEAQSRFAEKFGEKFKVKPFITYKKNDKPINPVGYQFILIDD